MFVFMIKFCKERFDELFIGYCGCVLKNRVTKCNKKQSSTGPPYKIYDSFVEEMTSQ